MELAPGEIHIWLTKLALNSAQEQFALALLSEDERTRAARLVRPLISQRFIIARSRLRQILGLYLDISPHEITFSYNEHNKPALDYPRVNLQFNLSHSDEQLLIAVTLDHAIGIDIEKIKKTFNPGIVSRFFSVREQTALTQANDPASFFYQIWSRKEAIIKALGKGLFTPPADFSVVDPGDVITFDNTDWFVTSLPILENYAAALASNQRVNELSYWQFTDQGPMKTER